MNYEQFKNKYSAELNDILDPNQDDIIEYGGNDWMDLLSTIWDGKDPYNEESTQEETSRVLFLEKYIAEEYNIDLV